MTRVIAAVVGAALVVCTVAGCTQPPTPRVAIKAVVVNNENTPAPNDVLVKLRWQFDEKGFPAGERVRFPECGFTLYRKVDPIIPIPFFFQYQLIGTFALPASEEDLKQRVQQLQDLEIKQRLVAGSGDLTQEGQSLWTTIEASANGTNDELPADATDLLLLAAVNPGIARILGLLHEDESAEPDERYVYKVEGAWGKKSAGLVPSVSCITTTADVGTTEPPVVATPSDPLDSPTWWPSPALRQVRTLKFERPTQQVTVFWDDPAGSAQEPPQLVPRRPVVELLWWKHIDDFVGYHIDRWEADDQCVERGNPTRINVLPNGRAYLVLSAVDPTEEKPERFLDSLGLEGGRRYAYRVKAVDIFRRESIHSSPECIMVSPMDFPPLPPRRLCLETFDDEHALLSETCPRATPDSPNPLTWVSPADLRQPKGTERLSARIKWSWSPQEQGLLRASAFRIYRIMNPDAQTPNLCQVKEAPPIPYRVGEVPIDSGRTIYEFVQEDLPLERGDTVTNYYFCITTTSVAIDDDNDGRRDEDPSGDANADGCPGICGKDDDGDGQVDETVASDDDEDQDQLSADGIDNDRDGTKDEPNEGIDEDPNESESYPSLPLLAYVVDKVAPVLPPAPCQDSWLSVDGEVRPDGSIEADANQSIDWDGKLAVRLDWRKYETSQLLATSPDIDGYYLYRTIDKPDGQYVRLNRDLIKGAIYVEHIEATAENEFYYLLQAVDKAGNESAKSDPSCPVLLPDKIPPTPPTMVAARGGNEEIIVGWKGSPSPDTVGYYVYRGQSAGEVNARAGGLQYRLSATPVTAPSAVGSDRFEFADGPGLEVGKDFFYVVEAVDQEGNRSFSDPGAGRAYDATPPKPPIKVEAKVTEVAPLVASKEDALVRVSRIIPPRVRAGEPFRVRVIVEVKASQIERVFFSEDLRLPFTLESGRLESEWLAPDRGETVMLEYSLETPETTPPGQYMMTLGTASNVQGGPAGQTTRLELVSAIEIVAGPAPEATVHLRWQHSEPKAQAAIWRCDLEACLAGDARWRMIAPLLPPDEEEFDDLYVAREATYYYKIQALDRVGNEGEFSDVLEVVVE